MKVRSFCGAYTVNIFNNVVMAVVGKIIGKVGLYKQSVQDLFHEKVDGFHLAQIHLTALF